MATAIPATPSRPPATSDDAPAPRAAAERKRRVSIVALGVCAGALAVVGWIGFGPHVLHGGLYRDDWQYWREYVTAPPGVGGALHAFGWTSFRPVQVLWWPLLEATLGPHAVPQLALTLLLAIAMSTCLFALLVTLGLEPIHSGMIAALVLLFPASDATRLWAAANVSSLGITLFLLGAIASLRAFDANGGKRVALHALGLALYLASILTYEIAAAAIASSIVLYRIYGARWRPAALRWAVDVAAMLPILLLVTTQSDDQHYTAPLSELPSRAATFLHGSLTVVSGAAVPFARRSQTLGLAFLAAAAVIGLLAVWRRHGTAAGLATRRWLLVGAGALWAIAAGYAVFALSQEFAPLDVGIRTRANALAAIGFVLLVYAALMVLATSLLPVRTRLARRRTLAVGAIVVAIGAGYVVNLRQDERRWDLSASLQHHIVSVVASTVPRPARGTSIYTFDHPSFSAPGVPVFNESTDLDAAMKARWHSNTQQMYPTVPGAVFYCEAHDIWMDTNNDALDDGYGDEDVGWYGKTIFVDVARRVARRIDSPRQCRAGLRAFRPGPLFPGGPYNAQAGSYWWLDY